MDRASAVGGASPALNWGLRGDEGWGRRDESDQPHLRVGLGQRRGYAAGRGAECRLELEGYQLIVIIVQRGGARARTLLGGD